MRVHTHTISSPVNCSALVFLTNKSGAGCVAVSGGTHSSCTNHTHIISCQLCLIY